MKCVFLDRDGTLVVDEGYNNNKSVLLLPDTVPALKILKELGYHLIVVTNQSGLKKGLVTKYNFMKQNEHMFSLLAERGVNLDAIEYCPHGDEDRCECRKPKTGMLEKYICDYKNSWMIGDKKTDVECGRKMGCRSILLGKGNILSAAKLIAQYK